MSRQQPVYVAAPHPWAVIPAKQLEAASGFGKLVAMGVLPWQDCIEPLLKAAQVGGYRGDERGARIVLAWRVRDAATTWDIRRAKADVAIRKVLGPLLQDRVPGADILVAAWTENLRWDQPFACEEVETIVREEAAWWVRQGGRVLQHA